MPIRRRRQKKRAVPTKSGIEQFGQSEIDAFHKDKDVVKLNPAEEADSESDAESSSDASSSDNDDSSDSDSIDEEEEEDRELKAWGKTKAKYYGADTNELEIMYDSDDAKDEEEEAKRLSKVQSKGLTNADFGLDSDDDDDDDDDDSSSSDEDDQALERRISKPKSKTQHTKQPKTTQTKKAKSSSATADDDVGVESIKRDITKLSRKEQLDIIMNDSPEVRVVLHLCVHDFDY